MSDRLIRVLHLAPMLQSGAGRLIVNLAIDSISLGSHSSVISTGRRNPAMQDWPDYVEKLRAGGVGYREIDFFSRDTSIVATSIAALAELLREEPFDVIHAHSGVPAAAAHAALAAIGAAIPVIVSFYSWGVGRPAWMDRDDLAAFRRCHRILVISRWYERFLIERGFSRGQVRMIPCGIDPALFTVVPDRAALERILPKPPGERPIAVILAVIEPRKNHMAALRALAAMHPADRPCLVNIGTIKDPGCHAHLQDFIRTNGLQDVVGFSGFVDDPFPAAAAADLFLFPSLSEGLGIAILEAMALGVPVIGNPVEGAADIIRDGRTALAIDPADTGGFAAAIGTMAAQDELRRQVCAEAREMIRREYLWPDTVARTVAEYRDAVAAANP